LHCTVICCMNKRIINERYIPEHQNKLNIYNLQNYEFFSTEKKFVKFEFSIYEYTVFQNSDAKIQITITTTYLTRIKYPLSGFNYHLSDVNVANFNKIHRTVSEQQLF